MKRENEPLNAPTAPESISRSAATTTPIPRTAVHPLEKWLLNRLMAAAGYPPIEMSLYGQSIYKPAKSLGRFNICDRAALIKLCTYPDLHFGELYMAGRLEAYGDLTELLTAMNRSLPDIKQRGLIANWAGKVSQFKRNTLTRARTNIHHHYDISNEFYRLWLDERMLYTCAYFPTVDTSLEDAQVAKMDHVCRKLRLKAGEDVVEAGCGWGALALHMAKHYGVKVKAYNISREQINYARERAKAEGLADRLEYIEGDYRSINGRYDVFVSVGMLEHVGPPHYEELGAVIDRCLREDGRGLIHSIGRNRPAPVNAWTTKRIFPGGYTPSLFEMDAIFEPYRFSILDVENLRLHYAKTLQHWLARFEAHADQVRDMFDEPFIRAWRLYLAGSTAAFIAGELQLFQVVFTRHWNNDIPLTRDFLYGHNKSD